MSGAKWNVVAFGGQSGAESRGIVDLIAIRKDHRQVTTGIKRGDLFEIVLIQVKGGSARRPSAEDVSRLAKVARHHRARAVVLADWKRAERLEIFKLVRSRWVQASPLDVFG
jgi:hypothetical protein